MKLKELIGKLQEIDTKYGRDLEVITLSEIGMVGITSVHEAFNESDNFEEEFELLSENPELRVNSVYLSWN